MGLRPIPPLESCSTYKCGAFILILGQEERHRRPGCDVRGPRGVLVIGAERDTFELEPEAPGEQQSCGFITLSFGHICTFFPCWAERPIRYWVSSTPHTSPRPGLVKKRAEIGIWLSLPISFPSIPPFPDTQFLACSCQGIHQIQVMLSQKMKQIFAIWLLFVLMAWAPHTEKKNCKVTNYCNFFVKYV